jgi:nicotinate-nucleotide pyrophosphorylase (carboxylating)
MKSDLLADTRIARVIESALMEDTGTGDVTTNGILSDEAPGFAELVCKGEGVIAGLEVAEAVFALCDATSRMEHCTRDGAMAQPGEVVAKVAGTARGLLHGERTALNFLQRMSGIATATRSYVDAVAGTGARITDTRKTAPGLRILDKMAVRLGGGVNHRFGLDDMVLIKDNHIVAAGSITNAVALCRAYLRAKNIERAIEVETKTLEEVEEALRCEGISRIMLDNFPLGAMRVAVVGIDGRVEVEASGGITLADVRAVAETGVDFISVGALTHSVKALDISLELSHHV